MINWVLIFTDLLTYAYVGIHQVRILVFDNISKVSSVVHLIMQWHLGRTAKSRYNIWPMIKQYECLECKDIPMVWYRLSRLFNNLTLIFWGPTIGNQIKIGHTSSLLIIQGGVTQGWTPCEPRVFFYKFNRFIKVTPSQSASMKARASSTRSMVSRADCTTFPFLYEVIMVLYLATVVFHESCCDEDMVACSCVFSGLLKDPPRCLYAFCAPCELHVLDKDLVHQGDQKEI